MTLSRRELLRRAAPLGAAAAGGALVGRWLWPVAGSGDGEHYGHDHRSIGAPGRTESYSPTYGHGPAPPGSLGPGALDARTVAPPPASGRGVRRFEIAVTANRVEVADGVWLEAWTYDGTIPGPVLRVTEGQEVEIHLRNLTSRTHNLHLHGTHDPAMDGWEPVPAGGAFTYRVTAAPFGLHPYHCHTHPVDEHVSRGLYGALIVDPPEGREPAHELVLVLGGFDLDGDGRNDLFGWNGVAGYFDRHPIRVPAGELVRCYLVNMVEHEPLASFHLHAQTFDLYRSGTSVDPDEHTDVVTLAQGERAIVEFRLPERGRYMFHPHQHHIAARGATGWFAAV